MCFFFFRECGNEDNTFVADEYVNAVAKLTDAPDFASRNHCIQMLYDQLELSLSYGSLSDQLNISWTLGIK